MLGIQKRAKQTKLLARCKEKRIMNTCPKRAAISFVAFYSCTLTHFSKEALIPGSFLDALAYVSSLTIELPLHRKLW